MTKTQKAVVITWQTDQRFCAFMAQLERESGNLEDAIFWQQKAAQAHVFAVSNASKAN